MQKNLPPWLNGQRTRPSCAVEHDALSDRHPPTKELFLIIPTYMMSRKIIPGRKGLMVSSINCDRCRHLDLAVSSLPAAPA